MAAPGGEYRETLGRPGDSATVYLAGTTTLATLYTDVNETTAAPNPTVLDSFGALLFFADVGAYDVLVNGALIRAEVTAHVGTYAPREFGSLKRRGLFPRGMIVLVQDDLFASGYTVAAPAVEAAGGRMSFAFYNFVLDTAGRMTSAQVTDLAARGHEIAAHSSTHPDMTSKTAAQREAEWLAPITTITALTGAAPTSWIYPVSARNAATDEEAYPRFERTFWGINGRYIIPNDQTVIPYPIGRFSWTSDVHGEAKDLIRLAAREPVRIIIYTHNISDNTGAVTVAEFQELIALCVTLGVPIVTLRDAFPAHRPMPQSTFADTNLVGQWDLTDVGTGLSFGVDDAANSAQPAGINGAGIKSLWITSTDAASSRTLKLKSHMRARGGQPFSFSCRVLLTKSSGTGGAYVTLDEYDAGGTLLKSTTVISQTADTAGAYVLFQPSLVLQARTAYVIPGFAVTNAVATGRFLNPWPAECAESLIAPPPGNPPGVIRLYKKATGTITAQATPQDDADFTTPTLPANTTWRIRGHVSADGPSGADIRFLWTAPSDATGHLAILGQVTSASSNVGSLVDGSITKDSGSNRGLVTGTPMVMPVVGELVMGPTAGVWKLQWSQAASDPGNTQIFAGSEITLELQAA